MQITITRLEPGQKAPPHSIIYLMQGKTRMVDFFDATPTWVCPETRAGFWYGYAIIEESGE